MAEAGSRTISPTPASDDVKKDTSARPLSTIDTTRTVPRTAKADGVVEKLNPLADNGDPIRPKCIVQLYDAIAGDSTAGGWFRRRKRSGAHCRQKDPL